MLLSYCSSLVKHFISEIPKEILIFQHVLPISSMQIKLTIYLALYPTAPNQSSSFFFCLPAIKILEGTVVKGDYGLLNY